MRSPDEPLPDETDPHQPVRMPEELNNTSRRQLAKKIHAIIKAKSRQEASVTTGLSRHKRWTNSDDPSVAGLGGIQISKATGNAANAQATAQNSAQAVSLSLSPSRYFTQTLPSLPLQIVKQRTSAFGHLKNVDSLASARVHHLAPIFNHSFGFAMIDNNITMIQGEFPVTLPIL